MKNITYKHDLKEICMKEKEISKQFEFITKEIGELKKIITDQHQKPLKESDVLDILGICAKTLRCYRNEGILSYSRIGNKYFYKLSDIQEMLNKGCVKAS